MPDLKKIAENLKTALEKPPSKMPLRRHHDDSYWDQIDIDAEGVALRASIVPRYKTSGLSGDEWRISAKLQVKQQAEVFERTFGRMNWLTEHAPHFLWSNCRALLDRPWATLIVRRKGVELMQQAFASFGDAAIGMGWHIVACNEGSKIEWHHLTDEEEQSHCQQVGCSDTPVNFYRLKQLQVGNGRLMVKPEYDFEGQFTWFCARHTRRGDCGLEDCDSNLVLVAGTGSSSPRSGDESESAFGGAMEVKLP